MKNSINTSMPWIDEVYCGNLNVASYLYKNKWSATIGLIFSKYVKRFFVLKMDKQLFCYYDDIYLANPHEYPISVHFLHLIANSPLLVLKTQL